MEALDICVNPICPESVCVLAGNVSRTTKSARVSPVKSENDLDEFAPCVSIKYSYSTELWLQRQVIVALSSGKYKSSFHHA